MGTSQLNATGPATATVFIAGADELAGAELVGVELAGFELEATEALELAGFDDVLVMTRCELDELEALDDVLEATLGLAAIAGVELFELAAIDALELAGLDDTLVMTRCELEELAGLDDAVEDFALDFEELATLVGAELVLAAAAPKLAVIKGAHNDITKVILRKINCQFNPRFN